MNRRPAFFGWLLVLMAPFVLCFLPSVSQVFAYDRSAVNSGEAWKVLTGSLSHLNFAHASLNVVALSLMLTLFGAWHDCKALFTFILLCFGVYAVEHLLGSNAWARGMSGPVYGFAVFGTLVFLNRIGALVVMSFVVIKLACDAFGLTPDTSGLIESRVLVEHHISGALLGLAAGLCLSLNARRLPSTAQPT